MFGPALHRVRAVLPRVLGGRPEAGDEQGADTSVRVRVGLAIAGMLVTATAAGAAVLWWSSTAPATVTVRGALGPGLGPTAVPQTYTPLPSPSPPSSFSDHEAGAATTAFVRVADQAGSGSSVTVAEATLTGGAGWVVIHADDYGTPGPIMGVSALLPAGTSTDISVPLTQPLRSSAYVIVMLHAEDNGNSTFDYPRGDEPEVVGGQIVDLRIWVKVG